MTEGELYVKHIMDFVLEPTVDLINQGNPEFMEDRVVADVHTQPTDAAGAPVGYVLHVGTGPLNMAIVMTMRMCMGMVMLLPVMFVFMLMYMIMLLFISGFSDLDTVFLSASASSAHIE